MRYFDDGTVDIDTLEDKSITMDMAPSTIADQKGGSGAPKDAPAGAPMATPTIVAAKELGVYPTSRFNANDDGGD